MKLSVSSVDTRKVWDEFIVMHCPGALFQSWLWGEVLKKQGAHMDRLGLYDEDRLVGIMQVQVVVAKRGVFLHVRHGPVILQEREEYWREMIGNLRKKARDENAIFIRVSPHIPGTMENRKLLSSLGFSPAPIHAMDAEFCWVLDITPSEEDVLRGMRKTTRYEIKRSATLGVTVNASTNTQDIGEFFRLYSHTFKRHGFVPHEGIAEEFAVFSEENKAVLFTGSYGGEVTAAAIILFQNGEAIYRHGASVPSKAPVTYAMQWRAIQEAKKRGMKRYNFWGIAPADKPKHPWAGITLFKKGFGGQEVEYIHAQDLPVSPLYVLPRTLETIRRIRKGY